ncbi:GPI-anchored surface protein, putative [Bodo saltans]|uniref:GPI-anchored surface protein, putative n=1 Tax=Bodo saltans TaxID=75058 RepID=A0A0S4KFL1_BODSA|nr:GPI-anchored surface protein, putative [Bodo saltans]|eukprot:CUI11983.1 GPI-anchored surface protein, putative [Bodo saltans]
MSAGGATVNIRRIEEHHEQEYFAGILVAPLLWCLQNFGVRSCDNIFVS